MGQGGRRLHALRSHIGVVPDRPISRETRETRSRLYDAEMGISVCPYCAVGCSQRVYHREGRLLSIEGNEDSFINRGTLCPKGSATSGLVQNEHRLTGVRYRAPYSDRWEDKPLDWAMDRIADRVKHTRDRSFVHKTPDGRVVNRMTSIAHLGGATLDNEENYLIKKLFTAGLGMVFVENQARI